LVFYIIFISLIEVIGNGPTQPGLRGESAAYPYMYMYPYWTVYPYGWGLYPAACASGLAGVGGWGAGIGAFGNIVETSV
jgi:hypothetical protein